MIDYYLTRANPLEQNIRVYRVMKGVRQLIQNFDQTSTSPVAYAAVIHRECQSRFSMTTRRFRSLRHTVPEGRSDCGEVGCCPYFMISDTAFEMTDRESMNQCASYCWKRSLWSNVVSSLRWPAGQIRSCTRSWLNANAGFQSDALMRQLLHASSRSRAQQLATYIGWLLHRTWEESWPADFRVPSYSFLLACRGSTGYGACRSSPNFLRIKPPSRRCRFAASDLNAGAQECLALELRGRPRLWHLSSTFRFRQLLPLQGGGYWVGDSRRIYFMSRRPRTADKTSGRGHRRSYAHLIMLAFEVGLWGASCVGVALWAASLGGLIIACGWEHPLSQMGGFLPKPRC